ncbi:hypothetical protein ASPFODRAFT_56873 [Aspergillus luchuensis CBS 106.47]|uniref:ATPase AAA-type core domain-containing protein n=1 Tax=Aspergillus luchuensis (strain CBS 106.47) TaxID=1137211 RepID=A0A1M3TVH7_ASPLC|nr:hypothetical protein ASPFODRAFT_56873 [Aspergillus luchuensis CBS 106.47]
MIGMDPIISLFRSYQKLSSGMRLQGIDPRPYNPFAFVFKGPPGTGKTTTARICGDIFYEMGFLSTSEVIDCSATNLIGEYVGQTGPNFAHEAVGELVDSLIVLAGYSDDMDRLLHINTGLRSRFPTDIVFPSMSPAHCLEYLEVQLGKLQIRVDGSPTISEWKDSTVRDLFARLQKTRSWANARDVETLARNLVFKVYKSQRGTSDSDLSVSMDDIMNCLDDMLDQHDQSSE